MVNCQWLIINCQLSTREAAFWLLSLTVVGPPRHCVSCTCERLMGQEITADGQRPFPPPHAFSTWPPSDHGHRCDKRKRPFPSFSPANRQRPPMAGIETNRNGRSSPIPFLQLSNTTNPTTGIRRNHNGRSRPWTYRRSNGDTHPPSSFAVPHQVFLNFTPMRNTCRLCCSLFGSSQTKQPTAVGG